MNNIRVREEAQKNNVYLWQIAYRLGMNDGNFSRKLRRELPEGEQEQIIGLIREISKEVANAAN